MPGATVQRSRARTNTDRAISARYQRRPVARDDHRQGAAGAWRDAFLRMRDETTRRGAILDTFDDLHRNGMTIIIVTHDAATAARCHRVVRLKDGLVEFDRVQTPSIVEVADGAMQPA